MLCPSRRAFNASTVPEHASAFTRTGPAAVSLQSMATFPCPHSLARAPRSTATRAHVEPESATKRCDPATSAHATPCLYAVVVVVVVDVVVVDVVVLVTVVDALVVSEVVSDVVCVVISQFLFRTPF